MSDPLPDLRARNFGRRCGFHQIEQWHRAATSEPGFKVLDADRNVLPQTRVGDWTTRAKIEQISRGDTHVLAFLVDLVWRFHDRVERVGRQLNHSRMRDPGAVVTVAGF